jgi:DHA1 family tetracycline resistance protein-like MFS transporter
VREPTETSTPSSSGATVPGLTGGRAPAVKFVLVTLMLDVLGFGLLIPVAPQLVMKVTGANADAAAGPYGYLMATYAVMQFLCSPVLGALSDRFGRRPVILISLLGSGIDYFAQAWAPTLWLLFLTRAINGVSGASMTAASAYIADVTPPEKRAGAFGLVGAAFGLGFVFGPLIGGALGSYDIHYPFYAAGAITLVNALYGYFILPESLSTEHRAHITIARMNPLAVFEGVMKHRLVTGLAAALFLFMLGEMMLRSTWNLSAVYRFGWKPWQVGLSLAIVGICSAIVQGGLARKVVPAIGERRSLLIGLGFAVFAYTSYGLATQGWMMYAIVAVACLGGIAQPAAQSLITRSVGPREQGRTQGAMTALQSLAAVIGPPVGTHVFAYFVSDEAPRRLGGAPFFLAAALAMGGWLVVAWVLSRPERIEPVRAGTHRTGGERRS